MESLRVEDVPGARALRLVGEIDIGSVESLQPALDAAATAGGPLVIDLRGLTFMDSTALHAWTKASELLAHHGWCIYLHVSGGIVERVLELAGPDRLPNIHVVVHPPESSEDQMDHGKRRTSQR
jgi:anti-sigma B factor antagonist